MISNCQICKSRATWHDLGKLEKNRINLVCDVHLPPEKERKGRKWVRNEHGWSPPNFKSIMTTEVKNR